MTDVRGDLTWTNQDQEDVRDETSSDNLVVKLLIANNFPNLLIVTSNRKKPNDLQRRQPTKKQQIIRTQESSTWQLWNNCDTRTGILLNLDQTQLKYCTQAAYYCMYIICNKYTKLHK